VIGATPEAQAVQSRSRASRDEAVSGCKPADSVGGDFGGPDETTLSEGYDRLGLLPAAIKAFT
jgi:hypothetical protein